MERMTDVTSAHLGAEPREREPAPTPGDDLGRLLDALRRTFLGHAADAFDDVPAGARGVRVMQVADGGACSNQASIASALGLDRTVMTYLVDDLEKAGLVTRRPDPADRRSRQVVVTAAGRAVLDRVGAVMVDVERQALGALSDDEATQLRRLLERAAHGMPTHDTCTGAPDVPSC